MRDSKTITINNKEGFPYLDIELYWRGNELQFRVHLNPGQNIKYLNKGSAHTSHTFKAIPSGVIRRLTSLTSINDDNKNITIDRLYPRHFQALEDAKLIKKGTNHPTLQESYDNFFNLNQADLNNSITEEEASIKKMKRERDRKRKTFFVTKYTKIWDEPISARIRRLTKKYKLSWLRTEIAYSKHTNFGEKLNGDLNNKVMKGIMDSELADRPCNCNIKSLLPNGKCMYGGNCRKSMVVYELNCGVTGKSYIGKTQDYLKKRTQQHATDVWKVIESGRAKYGHDKWRGSGGYKGADAFAKHFAHLCRECGNSNQVKAKLKEIMKPTILWQGDRIQCMKSAKTMVCKICMVERTEIIHRMRTDKENIMNDNSDIFAPCRCGSRFHKFTDRIDQTTLRTRMTQKKVPSTRHSKQRRSSRRFSFNLRSTRSSRRASITPPGTPESASPPETPVFLLDTNIPGLPRRPLRRFDEVTNLEIAQMRSYERMQETFDV